MNQKNMKKISTFEAAVNAIGEYIIGKKLNAGDVLPPEPALAASLGISRNILREALRHYRTLGLIESKPKVGTVIRTLIPDNPYAGYFPILAAQTDLKPKLAEMRESLEVGFAACMVQRITKEELQHLQKVCERVKHAYTPAQLAFTDMEFHIALLESARNPLLTGLIPLVVHFFATSEEPGNNQDPMQEYQRHLAIFDALSARDGERLTFLLRKHYHPYSGDSVL